MGIFDNDNDDGIFGGVRKNIDDHSNGGIPQPWEKRVSDDGGSDITDNDNMSQSNFGSVKKKR